MSDTARPPLLRRVPPGVLVVIGWAAGAFLHWKPEAELELIVWSGLVPWGWLLLGNSVVVAIAAVLLRRTPIVSLVLLLVVAVVMSMAWRAGTINFPHAIAVDIAVWYVAANGRRWVSVGAAALVLATLGTYSVLYRDALFIESLAWVVGLTVVIAWLVGRSMRQASEYADTIRAQSSAQAVAAERLRIARELHDMVAHSLGIIAIQAGVGSRVIATQPGEAGRALTAIEHTSRDALASLRQMVGSLRMEDFTSDGSPSETTPGLADLDRLIARTEDAGVRVDLRWRGERRPLPADIDVAAYRIIQEALTNVVRHAQTDSCQVLVEDRGRELSLEILDHGRGDGTHPDAGYGLAGMRERVALLQGHLLIGPAAGGGFRVTVTLPVPATIG